MLSVRRVPQVLRVLQVRTVPMVQSVRKDLQVLRVLTAQSGLKVQRA